MSTRHWKVVPDSADEKSKVGVGSSVVPEGPPSSVVSGAAVSTVNVREAGVESGLPSASVARTEKVCSPSVSEAVVTGDSHGAKVPVSSLHSNVAPASLATNSKVGVASVVAPAGPAVIVVWISVSRSNAATAWLSEDPT